ILDFDLVIRQPAAGGALRTDLHSCRTMDHEWRRKIPDGETRLVLFSLCQFACLPMICTNWSFDPGVPWIGTCCATSSFSRWMFCRSVLMFAFTAGAGVPWAGGEYRSAFTRIFSFGKYTNNIAEA